VTDNLPVVTQRTGPGRPPKYDPRFCEVVISIGERGGWLSEMAEACDVHRCTMDDWAAKHPEFSEALNRAKQKSQAFLEALGLKGTISKTFQAKTYDTIMKARFREDYTETKVVRAEGEVVHKHEGKVVVEQVQSELGDIFGEIADGSEQAATKPN